ncbi:MAG: hypothetical protein ACLGP3_03425 [Acidobacteriota bacterium]
MSTARMALAAVWLVLTAGLCRATAEPGPGSFDTPVLHRVVDLGRVAGSNARARLTCDDYSSFMVKELDRGEEGAAWFAIAPSRPGHPPACTRARSAAEKLIGARDWCGYFAGAKSHYVFLNACGAHNAGLDFAVYDARTGRRVFEDAAVDSMAGGVRFRRTAAGGIVLTYARVALFDCTLPKDKGACWSRIRGQLGLAEAAIPVCVGYEKQMTGTVVSYPVEVALTAKPSVQAIPGQIRCWPPE